MVKNESENIIFTLLKFVRFSYTDFFIYDTGSKDDTVKKITEFSNRHSLNLKIIIEEYDQSFNFSIARNKCLNFAKDLFKNNKFILFIDAEWYIENVEQLEYICSTLTDKDVYSINLKTKKYDCEHYRLFLRTGNANFEEPIHEIVISESYGCANSICFQYRPSKEGKNKSKERFERDLLILSENLQNSRSVFYYAQTLQNLGRKDQAIEFYKKRIAINDNNDEIYISLLRLSEIVDGFKFYYLKRAQLFNDKRVEAYLFLSIYLMDFFPKHAFRYIEIACSLEKKNFFFSRNDYYDFERWNIRAKIADMLNLTNTCILSALTSISFDYSKDMIKLLNKNNYTLPKKHKIINLILYSENLICYKKMKEIQESRLNSINDTEYYFYTESELKIPTLKEKTLYLSNESNILRKTIETFKFFENYDFEYIVRSNISTIIDFNNLDLFIKNFDYSGPLMYSSAFESSKKCMFASGTCIILSKRFIKYLIENEHLINYDLEDDVALGEMAIKSKLKIYIPRDNNMTCSESSGYISYRFKSENREDDCKRMEDF